MDHVIARRLFSIDGQAAECRFLAPVEDRGSYFCSYQIDWPEGMKQKRAGGVDKVQALLLAMATAHTDLLAARNMEKREVEWLDGEDLGLPVTPSVRDWDPDNRL